MTCLHFIIYPRCVFEFDTNTLRRVTKSFFFFFLVPFWVGCVFNLASFSVERLFEIYFSTFFSYFAATFFYLFIFFKSTFHSESEQVMTTFPFLSNLFIPGARFDFSSIKKNNPPIVVGLLAGLEKQQIVIEKEPLGKINVTFRMETTHQWGRDFSLCIQLFANDLVFGKSSELNKVFQTITQEMVFQHRTLISSIWIWIMEESDHWYAQYPRTQWTLLSWLLEAAESQLCSR